MPRRAVARCALVCLQLVVVGIGARQVSDAGVSLMAQHRCCLRAACMYKEERQAV